MLLVQELIWFMLLLPSITFAAQYECLPYPVKNLCIIDFIYYQPGDEPITFPAGYDHYRITSRSEKQIHSFVKTFDSALYEAMHRPSHIEMGNTRMESLILPPDLQLGNFAANSLSSVEVEEGKNYQISFLDLEANYLQELAFISSLENLEVLHLENNHISTISGSSFTRLTKLKYLYLQYNSFKSIPWTNLPRTLIHLDCSFGVVDSAEFTNVSLPSLKYMGLKGNVLPTINITALLQVAPCLKEAHLQNEDMTKEEVDRIKETLSSNNISFVDSPWYNYCWYDDNYDYIDGRCVRREQNHKGTGMAILLSGLVILLAATFIYIVMLTYRYMNR